MIFCLFPFLHLIRLQQKSSTNQSKLLQQQHILWQLKIDKWSLKQWATPTRHHLWFVLEGSGYSSGRCRTFWASMLLQFCTSRFVMMVAEAKAKILPAFTVWYWNFCNAAGGGVIRKFVAAGHFLWSASYGAIAKTKTLTRCNGDIGSHAFACFCFFHLITPKLHSKPNHRCLLSINELLNVRRDQGIYAKKGIFTWQLRDGPTWGEISSASLM